MNIYHTRSKIKSKRHQPTKNRETSALQLRKISWLITKKKKHSKILHKSQMAYKRRSLHLHFPTAFSSRSIWQREHSRQNIKVRASLHREPWKKKQQLISYNYYRRKCWEGCYFLPFSSPRPPLAQYWAKRQCLCAWLLCYIPTINREAREIFSKRENSLFWGLTFRNTFVRECRSKGTVPHKN